MTAHINLTESEVQGLEMLSRQTGKTQEQLIHDALAQLLSQAPPENWREAMQKARGIWKDRTDLPDVREPRKGWKRCS